MPQAAEFTITDAVSDGTTYQFKPLTVDPERSAFVSRPAIGSMRLTKQILVGLSPAKTSRRTNKVHMRLAVPIEITSSCDGGDSCSTQTARFHGEWILPEDMSAVELEQFQFMVEEMLNNSLLRESVVHLDPPW